MDQEIIAVPKNLFPSDSAKAANIKGYGLHHLAPQSVSRIFCHHRDDLEQQHNTS